MTGEFSPEYSDISPKLPTPELLTRKNRRVQLEMGERALMMDGYAVLNQPETRYRNLEHNLKASIIGQDEAIDAIIEAMDRRYVRMSDNPRPLATLAFLGPTGVGKSETAKVLADYITGGERRLIKIDCSNFSSGHEVANLTGSPKGYVGYGDKPLLDKKTVERPGTVVLFDEVEKGSAPLYNLMLQILGDGQLQLGDGSVTNFRETIIIMTSNLGAKEMNEHLKRIPVGFGVEKEDPSKEVLTSSALKAFKDFFSPEFVNRLDATVVFNPLDREGLGRVLDTKLAEANEQYADLHGVAVSLTQGTHDYLIDKALEERGMGARPLVRAFEKDVQSVFGRYLGTPQLFQGSQVNIYHRSECSEEVQMKFPDTDLIFTHRFDQDLYEHRENYQRQLEAERKRIEDARRLEEEKKNKKSDEVVFDPGTVPPDDQE